MGYTDTNQIGEVTEITGDAIIIRTDGTEESVSLGAPIYTGDIIETTGAGAVNIGFIDDSSFAVSEDARISIDEFVFDPANESGDQDFSVVRGMFMYTSGLIGRENPDSVEIETPVGSIGIRGTIIGGQINPDGESSVSVLEGAIVVRNDGGEQLLTNQFDTVKLTDRATAPSEPQALNVADIAQKFGAIESVSSNLFSSFEDQINQQKSATDVEGDQATQEQNADNAEAKEDSAEEVSDETAENVSAQESAEDTETELEAEETTEADVEVKAEQSAEEIVAEAQEAQVGQKAEVQQQRTETQARKTTAAEQQDDSVRETATQTVETISPEIIQTIVSGNAPTTSNNVNKAADITGIDTQTVLDENDTGLASDTTVATLDFTEVDSDASYQTQFSVNDARFKVEKNTTTGELELIAKSGESFDFETDGASLNLTISQTDGSNSYTDYSVTVAIADINDESPTSITIDSNSIAENASNGTIVGTLASIDADGGSPTYTIANDPSGFFEIHDGNQIKFTGSTLDFETQNMHDITVSVSDGVNPSYEQTITLNVTDINDAPELTGALRDKFSVTGDIDGVFAIAQSGARALELNVFDEEGTTFSTGDFSINGNVAGQSASNFFEIKDVNGKFFIGLKDTYEIVESSGNFYINDGTSNIGTSLGNSFDLAIQVSDGSESTLQTFTFGIGNIINVSSTEINQSASGEIFIGDASSNTIALDNTDFKFINGGNGHDLIKLKESGIDDLFDFTSTVSNLTGNSADIKSIEEFRFEGSGDTLKMNIADLKDLLKTSENNEIIFANGAIPDGTNATEGTNGINFHNGGSTDSLTNHGFTNEGTVNDNGENFIKFTHASFGDVLIEADMGGATTGGL